MRTIRPLVAVALLVASTLTSACVSIPTSGEVHVAEATPASAQDTQIRVLARAPRPGASPEEVVTGFLAASASLDNDHAYARRYLTPAASKTWRPEVGVAIYESPPGYRLTSDLEPNTVRMLGFDKAGSLDARGTFVQPAPGTQIREDFGMRKVAGQWRINTVPNGLILSTADVDRAYRALNLFYLDITGGILVPDPVFLPAQQPELSLTLTRQLLLGPTAWLAPAVGNAIPAGTKLAAPSVPIEDGIARVDLAPAAIEATGDDRRAVAAQITYTLTQLQGVTGVRITVGGQPFVVPGIGAVSTVAQWPSFNPDVVPEAGTYTIGEGRLNVIGESSTPVPGYFGRTKNVTAGAVSLDGRLMAAVLPAGSGAQVRFGPPGVANVPVIHSGGRIRSLSFDRLNQVWFSDRAAGKSTVWAGRADGKDARPIEISGLGARSIETLRVSRDGARVALLVAATAGGPAQLMIGRIQRESDSPLISGLRRVEHTLQSVDDVSWADDTTLLVVARRTAGESLQAYTVGIDGDSVDAAGSVQSMLTVAACPGRPYLTGTGTGRSASGIWAEGGNGWRFYQPGSVPIYPG